MLDPLIEGRASFPASVVAAYRGPVRRQLAIVDHSRLWCDCLKLALAHQPRRWRVTDVATAYELIQLMQHGEEFDVILLGGSTCANIDLRDTLCWPKQHQTPRSSSPRIATIRSARTRSYAPARAAFCPRVTV